MNSNYSLRFPRSSKEVYGYWATFNKPNRMDRIVFIVCAICASFVTGMIIGGLK